MHGISTFIGLFGLLKYILDRTMIENIRNFQEAVRISLKHSGKLSREEQNKLVLDMGTRMWANVVDDPTSQNVTLFSRVGAAASSLYCYMIPGFVRSVLFAPTYLLTLPVRLFVGRKRLEAVRAQTRKMAVEGLWSFTIPMIMAILIAAVLVQEVQYVRVVNEQGPTGPEINQHTVKRVVIVLSPDGSRYPCRFTLLSIMSPTCLFFLRCSTPLVFSCSWLIMVRTHSKSPTESLTYG